MNAYDKLAHLFLPGGTLTVLPSRQQPRLYLPADSALGRWQKSSFYPAFRPSAKLYRLILRAQAAAGLNQLESPDAWLLGDYIEDVRQHATSAVMLVGTPGPAQKITVQLWSDAQVVAYLKYAEKPVAKARLEQEYKLLAALPAGLGPEVLKYGTFAFGAALVTRPVPGRVLPAELPPPSLRLLLESWRLKDAYEITQHPWACQLNKAYGEEVEAWLAALSTRVWPVVLQHGDFAPWNILQVEGQLRAIDWEYGEMKGFPYYDLAYYLLQVAALVYRWSPRKARRYTVSYLSRHPWPGLSVGEAKALTALVAYHAYRQSEAEGHAETQVLQAWRYAIWRSLGT